MPHRFDALQALDDETWAGITELRVSESEAIRRHAKQRGRRHQIAPDGKLVILAADHPGRMVVDLHPGDGRLANRRDYLARILRVLEAGDVDGVMGTPDVIEELMAVDLMRARSRQPSLLDEKVIIGCMNRGGLSQTAFEMDDRFTAYTVEGLVQMNLDGAKMMFRLDPAESASLDTLHGCARAVNECLEQQLDVFIETFMVERSEEGYHAIREPRALMKAVSVASALGTSSFLSAGDQLVSHLAQAPVLRGLRAGRGRDNLPDPDAGGCGTRGPVGGAGRVLRRDEGCSECAGLPGGQERALSRDDPSRADGASGEPGRWNERREAPEGAQQGRGSTACLQSRCARRCGTVPRADCCPAAGFTLRAQRIPGLTRPARRRPASPVPSRH